MNVLVLTEDSYGQPFVRALAERLKREARLPGSSAIGTRRLEGECNRKLDRVLRANAERDSIVIVVDADRWRGDQARARERILSHVPAEAREKTRVVAIRTCIEEWICDGIGIPSGDDPVPVLDRWCRDSSRRGYDKSNLPTFVEKLDLDALGRNDSFRELLQPMASR